jgi:hypothetical protein
MQSLSSTQAKPSSHTLPVAQHSAPRQCVSFRQENPLSSPLRQTFCVGWQGLPSVQLKVGSQQDPANKPSAQVPSAGSVEHAGVAAQVERGQSQS